jgi:hypothetical protein
MSETTEPGCLATIREMLAAHEVDECRLTHGSMMAIVEHVDALRSRLESAERELKAARTPDIFGIDDMVVMGDDLGSFDLGPGDIDKVWANRYLGDRYVACRMGEDDEYEHEMFDTEAEAEAWAHSPTPTQGGTNDN